MKARTILGMFTGFVLSALLFSSAEAELLFSTGSVNNSIAVASRPGSAGLFEIESADDFALRSATSITSATFTGLLTGASPTVGGVTVEIYHVFPSDSNVARTSGPPKFSTSNVPTRVNSPSDVQFDSRNSGVSGGLAFSTTTLSSTFQALNSVQPGGIHSLPTTITGGNGTVKGTEVQFTVLFKTPFSLPADHYFFVPQVQVSGGDFLWLSAERPIVSGTAFPAGFTDLQAWTRDAALDPDWLRVGTDIVGGSPIPTFNAAFTLIGNQVPEPTTLLLVGAGLIGIALADYRRKKLS